MTFRKRVQAEKPQPHVYIACPAYDGKVDSDFALALAECNYSMPAFGVKVTTAIMANGAFIDLARNMFVRIFLEDTDCTHLLFIDSDLKFEARAVAGLALSGLPVCAGAYRRRQEPEDYPVKYSPHPELGGLWLEDDWILCDRVATGFLCIERSVVQEMADKADKLFIHGQPGPVPRLFYTYLEEDPQPDGSFRFVGEDFAWCDDYTKQYGKKIHVWPDFDFTHGGYKCNFQTYLNEQVKLADEAGLDHLDPIKKENVA